MSNQSISRTDRIRPILNSDLEEHIRLIENLALSIENFSHGYALSATFPTDADMRSHAACAAIEILEFADQLEGLIDLQPTYLNHKTMAQHRRIIELCEDLNSQNPEEQNIEAAIAILQNQIVPYLQQTLTQLQQGSFTCDETNYLPEIASFSSRTNFNRGINLRSLQEIIIDVTHLIDEPFASFDPQDAVSIRRRLIQFVKEDRQNDGPKLLDTITQRHLLELGLCLNRAMNNPVWPNLFSKIRQHIDAISSYVENLDSVTNRIT